ncbi:testis-specific expressed protein 55 [Ochotona curzoniae]|uniref:testis-specific expressed protein 55 n=1 Tax=Ochotona curzoniae TaxID=130825 RepID=UPI001B34FDBD|nr:testis-specific expressed protein 55 [Ochotona curzoniae]
MDESEETALVESVGHGNIAAPPNVDPTNDQAEENQENQADNDAAYSANSTTYHQADDPGSTQQTGHEMVPNQDDIDEYGQIEHQVSGLANRKTSQQAERKLSKQAERRTSEQTDHRMSMSSDGRPYEQTERRMSKLADPSPSGQTDHRMSVSSDRRASEQTDRKLSHQTERRFSEQTDRRLSSQAGRRTSEQTDRRLSSQAGRRTSEQEERRSSSQTERRASEEAEHRLSSQVETKFSEQSEHRLSIVAERRTSEHDETRSFMQSDQRNFEQIDSSSPDQAERTFEHSEHKFSNLNDQEISEQTDENLLTPLQRTSEHIDQAISDQDDHKPSHHQVNDGATELDEQQATDQADSYTDLTVDKVDYTEFDQVDYLMDKQSGDQEDYLSSPRSFGQYDDKVLPQFSDGKHYTDTEDRIQPCIFEDSQTKLHSNTSDETETESTVQAQDLTDIMFTSNFPAKDEDFDQTYPSASSKYDDSTSQENVQSIDINADDFYAKQTPKRKFPPIAYEDPYEVSLQYMEKHHILQIFQKITENLVYEKPEDPLNFMLCQVQEMMKNRGKI